MNTTMQTLAPCAPAVPPCPASVHAPFSMPLPDPILLQRAPRQRLQGRRRAWPRWLLAAALFVTIPTAAAWGWFFHGWESEQSALAILKPVDLASKPIFGTAFQNDLGRDGWILDRTSAIQPPSSATDPDLAPLTRLHHLAAIDLDFTQVTDAGLVYLKNLSRLQRLDLAGTRITNTGLASLQNLKQLRELDLESTDVTSAGIALLQSELPECRIYH